MLFETDNFGPYIVAAILFGIGSVIGFILCIIPGVIFVIFYGFYGFIIIDKGEQSPVEALKRSQQLVSGHFGAVLGLAVVLILINIVGALLCGIGLLFTVGISAIAWAYAYRALARRTGRTGQLDRSDRKRAVHVACRFIGRSAARSAA